MFDWDEGDRFSFEDSDRFEEDSLCSWISETESVCNNWRGWKKQNGNNSADYSSNVSKIGDAQLLSLVELSAKVVACYVPFEVVEHVSPPVPEQLQLRIAFWSFPENEEDIRLYSCLANGSADEFQQGEHLFKAHAVKDLLQIGFHLSAAVISPESLVVSKGSYNVAVTFDRCRITSCNCTCSSNASWCSHVVAVCLSRIHQPSHVRLRAPVSESLSQLHRIQLQKFAQYLISELPQQILPTAQRLLDELLSNQQTAINTYCGAPDPTAGASATEQTTWCLDGSTLHDNIRKILFKLCVPSSIVFGEVNYLFSSAPPAAAEWSSLLRPLRGREPEGLWNLLSIVHEMFRRNDRNAIPLLEILTEEVLQCDQILVWWVNTKVSLHMGTSSHGGRSNIHSNIHVPQYACSNLCDELVVLWRLAALNPALSPQDKEALFRQLQCWHIKIIEQVWKNKFSGNSSIASIRWSDFDVFPGFRPCMEACLLDWNDYPIPGVTYAEGGGRKWYTPYVYTRNNDHCSAATLESNEDGQLGRKGRSIDVSHLSSWCHTCNKKSSFLRNPHLGQQHATLEGKITSNRSSLSSEGFCENEQESIEQLEENSINGINKVVTAPLCQTVSGVSLNKKKNLSASRTNSQENLKQSEKVSTSLNDLGKCETEPLKKFEDKRSNQNNENSATSCHCIKITPQKKKTNRSFVVRPGEMNNESRPSSDEYQLCYYDPNSLLPSPDSSQQYSMEEKCFATSVRKIEDPLEILFARAEALHAHGHSHEACMLACRLAEELLANPPNLMADVPVLPSRSKNMQNFNSSCHHISLLASATLTKVAFLCSVLGEKPEYHHLAFRVGLYGLEMVRPPASTKALEVKMASQEQDLVSLLKLIPLTNKEMNVIRERAEQLRDGKLLCKGESLLPLMLASYIFDALVLNGNTFDGIKTVSDEQLGFEAAVAALGLKANVSEAEHPLLCEGTRQQRGDLAVTLLTHYKDDQEKLAKIMDKILDKEVHQMHKTPSTHYSSNNAYPLGDNAINHSQVLKMPTEENSQRESEDIQVESLEDQPGMENGSKMKEVIPQSSSHSLASLHRSDNGAFRRGAFRSIQRRSEDEGASSPGCEEDYKAWEAKFRCTNFRTNKKHSAGMASIDSSAPETTSSDNSPTIVRRSTWMKQGGPDSDSGSSGESSDSFGSSSSEDKIPRPKCKDIGRESVPGELLTTRLSAAFSTKNSSTHSGIPCVKASRFKAKKIYASAPNQPSEAYAYFMLDLAKTILAKAGGNSGTPVLFSQPSGSQSHRGPHRALHMCAFQTGLYALGLHNAVSPNWLSRTYSAHVSWITGQAMEIGSAAINYLITMWEGHLTPTEVASLADRASRGRDPAMVRAAAELALSCLPHAHALNLNDTHRALIQCKEQSSEMLERACLAVESAAKGGGVSPEVLFNVAHRWYEAYEESLEVYHSSQTDRQVRSGREEENRLPTDDVPSPLSPVNEHDSTATCSLHANQVEGVGSTVPSVQVLPPLSCTSLAYTLAYPTVPYGYISFPHSSMPLHPSYVPSSPNYPYGPVTNMPYYSSSATNTPHVCHTSSGIYNNQVVNAPATQSLSSQTAPVTPLTSHATVAPSQPVISSPQPQIHTPASHLNQQHIGYLLAAYRVGMLAMETLARRVHDDRPQAKYARNPPYGENVKWLLGVAKKLGTSYLQDFCICTVNSVASPFVLHEIIVEAAHYLSRSGSAPLPQPVRSHLLTPLIQKCQQMFTACTHFKMYHITAADYDEFVSIVSSARAAFQLTPGGMVQFNELLQSLCRTKSYKKELWQRIASALSTQNI